MDINEIETHQVAGTSWLIISRVQYTTAAAAQYRRVPYWAACK